MTVPDVCVATFVCWHVDVSVSAGVQPYTGYDLWFASFWYWSSE
jgi:hypothetical protein